MENALAAFAPGISRFLPGGVLPGTDQTDAIATPAAVALLGAYALALCAIAARTTLRKDIQRTRIAVNVAISASAAWAAPVADVTSTGAHQPLGAARAGRPAR